MALQIVQKVAEQCPRVFTVHIHSACVTDCALLQDALLEVLPGAAAVAGSGSHGGVFIGKPCNTHSCMCSISKLDDLLHMYGAPAAPKPQGDSQPLMHGVNS